MDEFASVLVPLLGVVFVPLLELWRGPRDPAAVRSMSRHTNLHDALPESARGPIRNLLEFEAAKYARATMRRGSRKVRGPVLATLIIVAGLLFCTELLIIGTSSGWVGLTLAGLVAGAGGALLSAGAKQIFEYEDVNAEPLEPAAAADDTASPADAELSEVR